MRLTSDYPFWSILNGLPATFPPLESDLTCDAVVIGGGITGALVGYHFVEAGIHTVLLDKRDIGTGSTCGSTGLLQYEVDVPLRQLVRQIGPAKAIRSYELCGEAVTKLGHLTGKLKIDCDFEERPSLLLARSPREISNLKAEFKLRRGIGFDLEFWDKSTVEEHFPFSRPAALFSQLGGQIDPHRLTHGLLAASRRRGLQAFDRSAVKRLDTTRRGVRLTTDRGFVVRARRAIVAAGFESGPFLPVKAGRLKSTYALVTEPVKDLRAWFRRSLIWETGSPYLYLRTTPDSRVIVGGEDVNLTNPGRRDALLPRKERILLQKCRSLFPELGVEVAYSWAGTFGETKDGLPYIGAHPNLSNAYFALGYGGNGITYSLIAAEIIRDDFLGHENRDAPIFRFDR